MSIYHKLVCVRFNDIHLLFMISAFLLCYLLLIVLYILYVFIRVYARTYINEHLRYLKCCLREANKF